MTQSPIEILTKWSLITRHNGYGGRLVFIHYEDLPKGYLLFNEEEISQYEEFVKLFTMTYKGKVTDDSISEPTNKHNRDSDSRDRFESEVS